MTAVVNFSLSVNPFQNFMIYGDRLMRILAEEALCRLPSIGEGSVETPCGMARGLVDKWKLDICLVSVVRSGITTKERSKFRRSFSIARVR